MNTDRLKTYRLHYAVNRGEFYEIEATSQDDAEDRAFDEGRQVDQWGKPTKLGDCHDCFAVECELIHDVSCGTGGGAL